MSNKIHTVAVIIIPSRNTDCPELEQHLKEFIALHYDDMIADDIICTVEVKEVNEGINHVDVINRFSN